MKKFLFCISLALAGLMTSCIDKYEEVDADSKPSWLGESIYAELENPSSGSGLQGTFKTYLRLIQDLGQADVLSRTGSKTVFPANDEAFERFFQNNEWGVASYDQLSYAQKVLLLKSSMLDNPLLLQLLPNVSNGTVEPIAGQALKHSTNVQITDTVQAIAGRDGMPANNAFWEQFHDTGISVVRDATRPMMVHLTREYMINNNITFTDEKSDFAIITGNAYPEDDSQRTAYIFNDKVIVPDVTCQNGYIHQMENVVVPPGNMAQVIAGKDNSRYMDRILSYFAVPVVSTKVTADYNAWARDNGKPEKEAIYQWRYLSSRSYDYDKDAEEALANKRVNGIMVNNYLNFDPGWNGYYPEVVQTGGRDVKIMDMGAFFVPTDQAVKDYFLPSNGNSENGHGAYLFDIYGNYKGAENTEEHLAENLDSLHSKNPGVLTAFVKNLMKASFAESVPSKFDAVLNDASENMGLTVDMLHKKSDGKYDITIANNGAVYMLDQLIAPDEYQAVLAPASVYPDMKVMNWAVQDRGGDDYHLGLDYKFYLLAMKANYAFFIPDDAAFDFYYLDPATLGHRENNQLTGRILPDVLHFWYEAGTNPPLRVERYYYNMETGQVEGEPRAESLKNVKTQLTDILNYHTLVLNAGEEIGANRYYKTKHGGMVKVDGENATGTHVMSGLQIDKSYFDPDANQGEGKLIAAAGFDAPTITTVYPEKNGHAYRLNRVIQAPTLSVYAALKTSQVNGENVFSDFLSMCNGFSNTQLLAWAGISDALKETGGTEQDAYIVFTDNSKYVQVTGSDGKKTNVRNTCLDQNVRMFNTYNYTLFAPDNSAMAAAYQRGLPNWEEVVLLYEAYLNKVAASEDPSNYKDDAEDLANQAAAKKMIGRMRDFVRYHFVTNSVYADNSIEGGRYNTLSFDNMGVAKELRISGGNGTLTISDRENTHQVSISAADEGSRIVNKMTRDYWLDAKKTSASSIVTSSFCAVHQISEPLCSSQNGRYDND